MDKGYISLERPVRLTDQSWPVDAPAQVAVCVPAFNHGKFIEECIQGVLKQETSFPVSLTVYDDASTDDTPQIIAGYATRYPRLVRSVISRENNYSRSRFRYFYNEVCCKSGAPFIAFCAGDDAWADPHKLEKQFSFLSVNPDYVTSGHDCRVVDDSGKTVADALIPANDRRDACQETLVRCGIWISVTTAMYRNVIDKFPEEFGFCMHEDSWLFSLLGHHGKYHFHTDIEPALYRKHDAGIWSLQSKTLKQAEWCNTVFWLHRYYQRIGRKDLAQHFLEMFPRGFYQLADTRQLLKATWRCLSNPITWQGALRQLLNRKPRQST